MDQTTGTNSLDLATEIRCPWCGYDLRGTQNPLCPECGREIDRSKLQATSLPWLNRELLGSYRAFWKTVNFVMRHPLRLGVEMNCPAHFPDALKFRRMVVLHAYVPLAVVYELGFLSLFDGHPVWEMQDIGGSIVPILMLVVGLLGLWLFLLAISGMSSYWFHPKSLDIVHQNRAIALSYYACAPLAYSPLTVPIVMVSPWIMEKFPWWLPPIYLTLLWLPVLGAAIVQLAMMIWLPPVICYVTTRQGWFTAAAMAIVQIVGIVVLGLLLLIVLPAMIMTLGVMLLGFHLV